MNLLEKIVYVLIGVVAAIYWVIAVSEGGVVPSFVYWAVVDYCLFRLGIYD